MPRVTYNATCQEISYHICLLTKTKLSFYEPKMPARAPLVAAQVQQTIPGMFSSSHARRPLTLKRKLMIVWLSRYAPDGRRKTYAQLQRIYRKGHTCIHATLQREEVWKHEAARLSIKFQVDGTSFNLLTAASKAAVRLVHGVPSSYDMTLVCPIETVTTSTTATATNAVAPSPIDLRTPAIARHPRRTLPKLDVCDRIEINYQHQHIRKTTPQLVQEWNSSESNINHILLPDSIDKNEVTFHHHLKILDLYDNNMEKHAIKQYMYAERGVAFSEYTISTIIHPDTALKHKTTSANIVRRARSHA